MYVCHDSLIHTILTSIGANDPMLAPVNYRNLSTRDKIDCRNNRIGRPQTNRNRSAASCRWHLMPQNPVPPTFPWRDDSPWPAEAPFQRLQRQWIYSDLTEHRFRVTALWDNHVILNRISHTPVTPQIMHQNLNSVNTKNYP